MKEEKKRALQKAMRLCSRSEKCAKDIRDKLYQWKVAPDWHDEIIEQLYEQNFLNEKRYVESFVYDKIYLNKWGKQKVCYALHGKEIWESVVNEVLLGIDAERYEENLSQLLQTKIKTIKADTEYEQRAKLIRFGLGRGFSIEEINTTINQIKNE